MGSPGPRSLWARGGQETDHLQGRSLMQDDLEKKAENHVFTGGVSLWNTVPE